MKRWAARCATGMCVAGMVVAAPGVALADTAASGQSETAAFSASDNMTVALYGVPSWFDPSSEEPQDLYGPPSAFEPGDEPIQLLYGPPSILDQRQQNPMTVSAKKVVSVRMTRLKAKMKRFPKAITVSDAAGDVSFGKVKKGSSKCLSVNKSTGAVKVKKGAKKGTYKIKVAIQAAGNGAFLPAYQEVTVKVRVK